MDKYNTIKESAMKKPKAGLKLTTFIS